MPYIPTDNTITDINNRFTYHAPKADLNQQERYVTIRENARHFALLLVQLCPTSRELSSALTSLDTCVMQANAAIARNE